MKFLTKISKFKTLWSWSCSSSTSTTFWTEWREHMTLSRPFWLQPSLFNIDFDLLTLNFQTFLFLFRARDGPKITNWFKHPAEPLTLFHFLVSPFWPLTKTKKGETKKKIKICWEVSRVLKPTREFLNAMQIVWKLFRRSKIDFKKCRIKPKSPYLFSKRPQNQRRSVPSWCSISYYEFDERLGETFVANMGSSQGKWFQLFAVFDDSSLNEFKRT